MHHSHHHHNLLCVCMFVCLMQFLCVARCSLCGFLSIRLHVFCVDFLFPPPITTTQQVFQLAGMNAPNQTWALWILTPLQLRLWHRWVFISVFSSYISFDELFLGQSIFHTIWNVHICEIISQPLRTRTNPRGLYCSWFP